MRTVRGQVVKGAGRGRKLGFPTANIKMRSGTHPPRGVWRVAVSGRILPERLAVCNVGVRPTVGGSRLTVEIHIPRFRGNLYRRVLTIRFLFLIRAEKKFASLEALKRQIHRDVQSLTVVIPSARMNA